MTPTLKLAATTERVRVASARSSSRCRASKPVVPTTSAGAALGRERGVAQRRVGHAGEVDDDVLGAEDAPSRSSPIGDAERGAAGERAGVLADAGMPGRLDGARDAQPGVLARRG